MRTRRLKDLVPYLREGRYRLGPHVARHMRAEGFTELDLLRAVEHGRELALYPEDERMLVLGYIVVSPRLKIPLHVVLEYSRPRFVEVVTAFIPHDPYRVYSRARLAVLLSFDGARERAELVSGRPGSASPRSRRRRSGR